MGNLICNKKLAFSAKVPTFFSKVYKSSQGHGARRCSDIFNSRRSLILLTGDGREPLEELHQTPCSDLAVSEPSILGVAQHRFLQPWLHIEETWRQSAFPSVSVMSLSSLRSSLALIRTRGMLRQWCHTSGYHFAWTFSQDAGLTGEKQIKSTSACGEDRDVICHHLLVQLHP